MDRTNLLVASGALVAGVVLGALLFPDTDAVAPSPTVEPSPTSTAVASPPAAEGPATAMPAACQAALAVADEAVRFAPDALSRLRAAYERHDSGPAGGAGPPPAATFSQLQSQLQSMTASFATARSSCEGAAARPGS